MADLLVNVLLKVGLAPREQGQSVTMQEGCCGIDGIPCA